MTYRKSSHFVTLVQSIGEDVPGTSFQDNRKSQAKARVDNASPRCRGINNLMLSIARNKHVGKQTSQNPSKVKKRAPRSHVAGMEPVGSV
jgi:hypothetical protein